MKMNIFFVLNLVIDFSDYTYFFAELFQNFENTDFGQY